MIGVSFRWVPHLPACFRYNRGKSAKQRKRHRQYLEALEFYLMSNSVSCRKNETVIVLVFREEQTFGCVARLASMVILGSQCSV